MDPLADVLLEDPRWKAAGLEALSQPAVHAALTAAGVAPKYEVCVLGCDDARIAVLNAEFRGKPAPTNVLSWPAFDLAPDDSGRPPLPPAAGGMEESLGDIAIAYETCLREAAEKGIPAADHITHLIIHGTLHLLGYDHQNDVQANVMEGLEVKALASMGIKAPY